MIKGITEQDIPACVQRIRSSFQTVADTFSFTLENAPRFTAFATDEAKLRQWYALQGYVHTGTKKFDFFPFTCGYMEKTIR